MTKILKSKKVKVQKWVPLPGTEHETLVNKKNTISPEIETPSPPCPSWSYIFRTSWLFSTLQSAPWIPQGNNLPTFCCKIRCANSNMIHRPRSRRVEGHQSQPLASQFMQLLGVVILAWPSGKLARQIMLPLATQ